MFKLGYKQIILNSLPDGSSVSASGLTVPGFCDMVSDDTFITAHSAVAPAGGVFTLTVGSVMAANHEMVKVSLSFRSAGHGQGGSAGNRFTFMSGPISAATPTVDDIATAIAAGFNSTVASFGDGDFRIKTMTASGAAITITMKDTSADVVIDSATVTAESNICVAAAVVMTTAPNTGMGYGWQVEQDVQLSTLNTRDPYRIKLNGSDTVNVKDTYKEYIYLTHSANNGYEPEDALGYGDVNTEAEYGLQGLVIFASESNSTLITALSTFTGRGGIDTAATPQPVMSAGSVLSGSSARVSWAEPVTGPIPHSYIVTYTFGGQPHTMTGIQGTTATISPMVSGTVSDIKIYSAITGKVSTAVTVGNVAVIVLSAPTPTVATQTVFGKATANWSAVPGATGYDRIWVLDGVDQVTGSVTGTTTTLSGIPDGTDVKIKLVAKTTQTTSPSVTSNSITVVTVSSPTLVFSGASGAGKAILSWTGGAGISGELTFTGTLTGATSPVALTTSPQTITQTGATGEQAITASTLTFQGIDILVTLSGAIT